MHQHAKGMALSTTSSLLCSSTYTPDRDHNQCDSIFPWFFPTTGATFELIGMKIVQRVIIGQS